jgi:hypothetical protein
MEEMVNIDDSILELADMPFGYCAKRIGKKAKWVTEPIN